MVTKSVRAAIAAVRWLAVFSLGLSEAARETIHEAQTIYWTGTRKPNHSRRSTS